MAFDDKYEVIYDGDEDDIDDDAEEILPLNIGIVGWVLSSNRWCEVDGFFMPQPGAIAIPITAMRVKNIDWSKSRPPGDILPVERDRSLAMSGWIGWHEGAVDAFEAYIFQK